MAQSARLLLVDDDPDFCEALGDRLRAKGFQVTVAERGPEALRLCREETPAIVLLDLVLPGMDGMAVLETIRRESPDVVVIVITGHGTIAVVGGVAANSELRAALPDARFAPLALCTDNAAMIASAARFARPLSSPGYLALDAYASA